MTFGTGHKLVSRSHSRDSPCPQLLTKRTEGLVRSGIDVKEKNGRMEDGVCRRWSIVRFEGPISDLTGGVRARSTGWQNGSIGFESQATGRLPPISHSSRTWSTGAVTRLWKAGSEEVAAMDFLHPEYEAWCFLFLGFRQSKTPLSPRVFRSCSCHLPVSG
jgi:hypothetical protein